MAGDFIINMPFLYFCLSLAGASIFSAGIAFYLIRNIIKRASKWGILDLPGDRKRHTEPIPRLGGLSLVPALWAGCSLTVLFLSNFPALIINSNTNSFFKAVLGLSIGVSGAFFLGALDDFFPVRVRHKLFAQLSLAFISIYFLPIPSEIFGVGINENIIKGLFIAWLVIVPNSVNLLDGIDGVTSVLMIGYLSAISLISYAVGELGWLLITLPLISALFCFIKFNWDPAKIFLGDSGSLMLGFFVAFLSLYFASVPTTNNHYNFYPSISFLLVIIWLTDTFLAIGRRYVKMHPPFQRRSLKKWSTLIQRAITNIVIADDHHIHHKFLKWGFSVPQTVAIIASFEVSVLLMAISLRIFNTNIRYEAPNAMAPILLLGGILVLVSAFAFSFYGKRLGSLQTMARAII
ncbi:MAG: UDP-phosphate N-acetylglucosaminyl 1-phosphate transferase [Bacteriovoracaceae bacterium]|nr:UDP-phosphate N-acetylglucosaminyl 1-phosphate transferase [Bacteriovoracaceae bacterium]